MYNILKNQTPLLLDDTHVISSSTVLNISTDDLNIALGDYCVLPDIADKLDSIESLLVSQVELNIQLPGVAQEDDRLEQGSFKQTIKCIAEANIDSDNSLSNKSFFEHAGIITAQINNIQEHKPEYSITASYNIRYNFENNSNSALQSSVLSSSVPMLSSFVANKSGMFFPLYNDAKVAMLLLNGQNKSPIILGALHINGTTMEDGEHYIKSKTALCMQFNDTPEPNIQLSASDTEKITLNNEYNAAKIIIKAKQKVEFNSQASSTYSATNIYFEQNEFYTYSASTIAMYMKKIDLKATTSLNYNSKEIKFNAAEACVDVQHNMEVVVKQFQLASKTTSLHAPSITIKAKNIKIKSHKEAEVLVGSSKLTAKNGNVVLAASLILLDAKSILVK